MTRYASKLLFQFRVVNGRTANKRRLCEERIVLVDAASAREALTKAKRAGRAAEHRYSNDSGGTVHFDFIGVLDLLQLGGECDPDEVWYELRELLKPMERKKALVPPESKLNAISWERRTGAGKPRRRGRAG